MTSYLVSVATIAGVYAMLALSLNLSWGLTGLINFGLSGLLAVGAYTTAIATKAGGVPIPLGILLAIGLSAAGGVILALVTLRLRGDYFAIVTLGFAELMRLVASNETWATGGTDGISNIPGPWRASLSAEAFAWVSLALVTLAVVGTFLLVERIRRLPLGRALRAIRDDEVVAAVSGKRVAAMKVKVCALVGAIAGLGGALYAHYTSYIGPDLVRPLLTVYAFLALTVGGTGNNLGALLGGYFVLALLEGVRFLGQLLPGLDGARIGALREIVVALLLIVALRLRPRGLLPEPVSAARTLRRRSGLAAAGD